MYKIVYRVSRGRGKGKRPMAEFYDSCGEAWERYEELVSEGHCETIIYKWKNDSWRPIAD